ncbi:hypothetical protein BGAPBR_K0050 (plasmid) [Borreliella garinii PBr]|uniref:Uncharacterized protein n=1 Tax=Borreliella garinii PBr TaxID=498743 RepID=B8F0T3_BORGR|nr:hypothetical protein BGAPBR_K0050 [Borreliella garinii PBr]
MLNSFDIFTYLKIEKRPIRLVIFHKIVKHYITSIIKYVSVIRF